MKISVFHKIENIVGKRENAFYHHIVGKVESAYYHQGLCGKGLTFILLNKRVELSQVGKAALTSLFQGCFNHTPVIR